MFLQKTAAEGSEAMKSCAKLGDGNREVFTNARRQGKRCRDHATWIGLERYGQPNTTFEINLCFYIRVDSALLDSSKFMVESPQQIIDGIESGGFKENDFVNIFDATYRICAPTASVKEMSSAILWTKLGKNDEPEWSKVVSIFCHFNMRQSFNIFSDRWICL
jgi:hypothetical protein